MSRTLNDRNKREWTDFASKAALLFKPNKEIIDESDIKIMAEKSAIFADEMMRHFESRFDKPAWR